MTLNTLRRQMEPVTERCIIRLWTAVTLLSLLLPPGAYPGAAGPARPGLGVSRSSIQAVLARQPFAFTFDAPHERHGVPHVTGTVPGKLIVLNLVGPPKDLTEVTLIIGAPSSAPGTRLAPEALAENTRYLRAVLQQAVPDWKDSAKWLNTQLQRSPERLEVGVRKGHREIVLLGVNRFSMVLLSVRVGQPSATRSP